jgi:rubrerythrin
MSDIVPDSCALDLDRIREKMSEREDREQQEREKEGIVVCPICGADKIEEEQCEICGDRIDWAKR